MRLRRLSLIVLAASAVFACSIGSAQAAAIYDYNVGIDDGTYLDFVGGRVGIDGLDTTKTRRIVVTPPSGPNRLDTGTLPVGTDFYSSAYFPGLAAGDTITVRQPATSVAPTEVFTIPDATLNVVTGATALTGVVPAGWIGSVRGDYRCGLSTVAQTVGAGAFSVPSSKILPGETSELSLFSSTGDNVSYDRHSPGETPCITVDASADPPSTPGGPTDPTPYEVSVQHLLPIVSPSVRLVLRRGASVLVDVSEDSTDTSERFATKPLAGDIVDVYRPKTAPTPTFSMTVPQASGVFDYSVDRVALKTPAASILRAYFCRVLVCVSQNARTALDTPAGVNYLDFSQAQGTFAPVDLRADDVITGEYEDPDHTLQYYFDVTPGDLVAPTQSFKLPSKTKLKSLVKAFKKGFKVNLKSNEVGTASLALTLPPAKTKSKKKPKTITLATAVKPAVVGNTTIYLKFTKSGKKALKKLSKKVSRAAVLTSTVTDASGNVSTIVKTTKIKP